VVGLRKLILQEVQELDGYEDLQWDELHTKTKVCFLFSILTIPNN